MAKIHPVLLSGGGGSRLWPLSRENLPKQFLSLTPGRTLLQQAALRTHDPLMFEPLRLIASWQHRFVLAQQLQEIGVDASAIVLEPSARGTAAAAAIAALLVAESDPEGLVLLAPADHRILDVEAFHAAIGNAAEAASKGFLSLFGITPDRPATGYGYIHVGEALAGTQRARRVAAFVEKPDRETAEGYLRSGDYLWNSGIFLLPVAPFIAELARYEPEMLGHARAALASASRDADFLRLDPQAFERCRSISIDHAVMERTNRMAVIPVECGWTDVGSWSTLADIAERDALGNTTLGDVLMESTRNSYIRSEGPLVATVGVEDLVVVATPDAILVAHKDRDQDVKRIVDRLRDGNRTGGRTPTETRPWGAFFVLEEGPGFKVKRIVVKPGGRLSLQSHKYRSEHWTVIAGEATVTVGEAVTVLRRGEAADIPMGHRHRLENFGDAEVELIEVQFGDYLGEDDIVRYQDVYSRA